jgi:hypothetical protein
MVNKMTNESINWNGGECPVAPVAVVQLKFCDGSESIGQAMDYDWITPNKIQVYRIYQTTRELELEKELTKLRQQYNEVIVEKIVERDILECKLAIAKETINKKRYDAATKLWNDTATDIEKLKG